MSDTFNYEVGDVVIMNTTRQSILAQWHGMEATVTGVYPPFYVTLDGLPDNYPGAMWHIDWLDDSFDTWVAIIRRRSGIQDR